MAASAMARATIRYLAREGLGVSVDPGQHEGDISRRSDKFGRDYAAVTFIFIEILHPNDQPYFSIGGWRTFLRCPSPVHSSVLPFGESGRAIWGCASRAIPCSDNVRVNAARMAIGSQCGWGVRVKRWIEGVRKLGVVSVKDGEGR